MERVLTWVARKMGLMICAMLKARDWWKKESDRNPMSAQSA